MIGFGWFLIVSQIFFGNICLGNGSLGEGVLVCVIFFARGELLYGYESGKRSLVYYFIGMKNDVNNDAVGIINIHLK